MLPATAKKPALIFSMTVVEKSSSCIFLFKNERKRTAKVDGIYSNCCNTGVRKAKCESPLSAGIMALHSQGHHKATTALHGQGTAWVTPGFKPATGSLIVPLLTMYFGVAYCSHITH